MDASKFYHIIRPSRTRRNHDFKLMPQAFRTDYFKYSFSIVTSVNGILSPLMLSTNLALILSKSPFQVICTQSCINSHTLYKLYLYQFYFMLLLIYILFLSYLILWINLCYYLCNITSVRVFCVHYILSSPRMGIQFPSAATPPSFTVPFFYYYYLCMDGKALLSWNLTVRYPVLQSSGIPHN